MENAESATMGKVTGLGVMGPAAVGTTLKNHEFISHYADFRRQHSRHITVVNIEHLKCAGVGPQPPDGEWICRKCSE